MCKNGSLSADIQKGDILMSVDLISSVADYQLQAKLYGDDLDFIGYPAVEGSSTAVSFRGRAINAKGETIPTFKISFMKKQISFSRDKKAWMM